MLAGQSIGKNVATKQLLMHQMKMLREAVVGELGCRLNMLLRQNHNGIELFALQLRFNL